MRKPNPKHKAMRSLVKAFDSMLRQVYHEFGEAEFKKRAAKAELVFQAVRDRVRRNNV